MKNQNESLDESDFEYMQAERDVWKARYEFACADRKKLLSDNAGLVKNQESNTAAFLAMREERDALMDAIKHDESQSAEQVSMGDLQDKCCEALKRYKKVPTNERDELIARLRDSQKRYVDTWVNLTNDAADMLTADSHHQKPHGWMMQGSNQVFKGEFAELDSKAEAKRCGGTCYAYPIYTKP